MDKVLIFKTSSDETMRRLFNELNKNTCKIDCLIQSSQINRYRLQYQGINFIDICREGFYDLPMDVINRISLQAYDYVYVTFSGIKGHNYGNIMELVEKIRFKKAFFYNCNGDKVEIPRKKVLKDAFCRLYIKWVGFIYGLRCK